MQTSSTSPVPALDLISFVISLVLEGSIRTLEINWMSYLTLLLFDFSIFLQILGHKLLLDSYGILIAFFYVRIRYCHCICYR